MISQLDFQISSRIRVSTFFAHDDLHSIVSLTHIFQPKNVIAGKCSTTSYLNLNTVIYYLANYVLKVSKKFYTKCKLPTVSIKFAHVSLLLHFALHTFFSIKAEIMEIAARLTGLPLLYVFPISSSHFLLFIHQTRFILSLFHYIILFRAAFSQEAYLFISRSFYTSSRR